MKTEISRHSHNPEKRYSGVYQQQGRMLTDSDINEQVEIGKERINEALTDVIISGTPRQRGLAITPNGQIKTGRLYVDGVAAEVPGDGKLIDYTDQPDFPSAPTIAGSDYLLYADVWERTVTALEDHALLDSGLHGADTCTRTQTMAQIKWCPLDADPENIFENPDKGTARLQLSLNNAATSNDCCDPCGEELSLNTRTGNDLFRVEVHRVEYINNRPEQGVKTLTLKWSSSNAAAHYPVGDEPNSFVRPDRVYELFTLASEKQFGVHLVDNPDFPLSGQLSAAYPATTAGYSFIRQWDGYAEIDLQNSLMIAGIERASALSLSSDSEAIGYVDLAGDQLSIKLTSLTLNIDFASRMVDGIAHERILITGDYWMAAVRENDVAAFLLQQDEAIQSSVEVGDVAAEAIARARAFYFIGNVSKGARPDGVEHHYLTLARVEAGNAEMVAGDGCTQFNFPPLTDIQASDVCYDSSNCDVSDADTVQEALDALCSKVSETCCTYIVKPHLGWESIFDEIEKHQSAHICFMEGTYYLNDTVRISGKGFLHLTGAGAATRIQCRNRETALHFENCSGVTLRDLYVESGSTGFSRALKRLNGTITASNCGEVVVVDCRIKCAAGTRKAASCITVSHDVGTTAWSGKERTARVSNCLLNVGHYQIGMLLLNLDRTHVEGCQIATRSKPNSITLEVQARDRAFAAHLTRFLISEAEIRSSDGGKIADSRDLLKQTHTVQSRKVKFKSVISSGSWKDLLISEAGGLSLKSNQQLLDVAKAAAEKIVMNRSFRKQFAEFNNWFDDLKQAYPAVISQAVVCAGQVAKEVRILNNTIEGALEGIRVAVSNHSRGREGFDQAGTVMIDSNVIRLLLPPWGPRQRQGTYIGNCNHLSYMNNHISVQWFNLNTEDEIDGIRVYGHLGRMIMIRQNFMSHCTIGVYINALNNDVKTVHQWLVADNLFAEASTQQMVNAPINVIRRDNVN